jgi:hypothetical protein
MTTKKKSTQFFMLDEDEYEARKQQAEEHDVSIDYFIMEFCEIHDIPEK